LQPTTISFRIAVAVWVQRILTANPTLKGEHPQD